MGAPRWRVTRADLPRDDQKASFPDFRERLDMSDADEVFEDDAEFVAGRKSPRYHSFERRDRCST